MRWIWSCRLLSASVKIITVIFSAQQGGVLFARRSEGGVTLAIRYGDSVALNPGLPRSRVQILYKRMHADCGLH